MKAKWQQVHFIGNEVTFRFISFASHRINIKQLVVTHVGTFKFIPMAQYFTVHFPVDGIQRRCYVQMG